MRRRIALFAIPTLALAGCSTGMGPTPEPTPAPSEAVIAPPANDPAEDLTLGEIGADVLLVITAKATSADGSTLRLESRVRTPVAFDDVGGYTVPAAAIASCPDLLSESIAAQNLWTFTRVNVLAVSEDDSIWPADQPIAVLPSTQYAPIASMSFLGEVPGPGMPCQLEKFVPGQGKGAISIGTSNDATDRAAGGFRRWSQLDYGFVTAGTDVVLSECNFQLTQSGIDLGGGVSWKTISDGQNCVTGAQTPASLY